MKESILVNRDEILNESEYCKHCIEQEYNDFKIKKFHERLHDALSLNKN